MPTPDDFRALARSAPWRFTTAHFTQRAVGDEPVEAWLERPGRLRYRCADGPLREQLERPREYAFVEAVGNGRGRSGTRRPHWGRDVEPERRPDGLVAVRPQPPAGGNLDYDDPMVGNYLWVAMLDPVELSEGVAVSDMREVRHHGRTAWSARCVPEEEYDPRCACCALLWSRISDASEGRVDPATSYPEAFDVVLDHGTGMVVSLLPVGWTGSREVGSRELGFDVEIHAAE